MTRAYDTFFSLFPCYYPNDLKLLASYRLLQRTLKKLRTLKIFFKVC